MKKFIVLGLAVLLLCGGMTVSALGASETIVLNEANGYNLDLKIHLKGDINGDGKVNSIDKKILYNHINEISVITDEYQLEVANVNGDAKINSVDKKLIYNHINEISSLWDE